MSNIVFVTIAVRAPAGISQSQLTDHVVQEMRTSRGYHMPDDPRKEFEYGKAGRATDKTTGLRVWRVAGELR